MRGQSSINPVGQILHSESTGELNVEKRRFRLRNKWTAKTLEAPEFSGKHRDQELVPGVPGSGTEQALFLRADLWLGQLLKTFLQLLQVAKSYFMRIPVFCPL